ncbi:SRPBCC family protein [Aquincola sp. MAHUQ-54]|uniref:SRPBCC family protein n=1 Tax=Aquincola agrisoli TaxID=3119538 RepID=A0AAW9QH73_9BURK
MQLEQAFTLAAAPDAVWQAFHDVALLVDCLPGASLKPGTPVPAAGEAIGTDIPLMFKVKLGPIAAGFAGQGQLTLDEAARSGSFAGSAIDTKTNTRVKGEARFALQPEAAGVRVAMVVDYTITGTLAQFSREGIVRALAEQLTKQFADNLQARLPQAPAPSAAPVADGAATLAAAGITASAPDLSATAAAVGPAVAAPAPRRPAAAAADTSSIDLWSLLKAWLRGLFARPRA